MTSSLKATSLKRQKGSSNVLAVLGLASLGIVFALALGSSGHKQPSLHFAHNFSTAFDYAAAHKSVERVAAPWQLTGQFFGVLAGWTSESGAGACDSSTPEHNMAMRRTGNQFLGLMVSYATSPVGPYDELVVSQPFQDVQGHGKPAMRVTRIYVSTLETLINGRDNWDVPKELANFTTVFASTKDDLVNKAAVELDRSYDRSKHRFARYTVQSVNGDALFSATLQLRAPSLLTTPSVCFDKIPFGTWLQTIVQPSLGASDYTKTVFNVCGGMSLASITSIQANGPVSCLADSLQHLVPIMPDFQLEFGEPTKGSVDELVGPPLSRLYLVAALMTVVAVSVWWPTLLPSVFLLLTATYLYLSATVA
ncbi:hypothetical protein HDV03_000149 [Kappamyces sp. JEL0829]|nr:hypothetical protein HDV03_000149 [Kappamyces sp. JEL0829]